MNDDTPDRTHPTWDALNDVADRTATQGRASADDAASSDTSDTGHVAAHVAACAACQATVASIQRLSRDAAALERTVAPPPVLWGDIAASIAAGGVSRVLDARTVSARRPAADTPPVPPTRTYQLSPRLLAAAALVLMALTSGVTARLMRVRDTGPVSVASAPRAGTTAGVAPGGTPGLPASFAATESAFLVDLAALHAAFVAQRSTLAPSTVAVVERSLATIDAAIAEARAALVADPANQSLAELLSTTYQHKVELLRRATEYSAS